MARRVGVGRSLPRGGPSQRARPRLRDYPLSAPRGPRQAARRQGVSYVLVLGGVYARPLGTRS